MPAPTISVILPVFNAEKTVSRALNSVLAQTFDRIEIVCIDDQSNDRSRDVIRKYCQKDSRVRLITHEVNKGHGPARNTGIAAARGDYLFHVDPDDTLPRKSFEVLHAAARKYHSDLVRGCYRRVRGRWQSDVEGCLSRDVLANTNIREHQKLKDIPAGHWLGLYSSTVFKDVLYPEDVDFAYDMVFLTKAYVAARTITLIPDVVYFYHDNPVSVMNSPITMKKLRGEIIWKEKAHRILCDAGLVQEGQNRFTMAKRFTYRTYWAPMAQTMSRREIGEYFEFFRQTVTRVDVPAWDSNTHYYIREMLRRVMSGRDDDALKMIQDNPDLSQQDYDATGLPTVSLILFVDRNDDALVTCLNSIAAQDLGELEVLFVIAFAAEDIVPVLKRHMTIDEDNDVMLVSAGATPAEAKNVGLDAATGKYVRFMRCDEALPESALSNLYALAQSRSSDIVRAGVRCEDRDDEVSGCTWQQVPSRGTVAATRFIDCESLWRLSACSSYFYKRSFLERNGLRFDEASAPYEDYVFGSQALPRARVASALTETCVVTPVAFEPAIPADGRSFAQALIKIRANLEPYPDQYGAFVNHLRRPILALLEQAHLQMQSGGSDEQYQALKTAFVEVFRGVTLDDDACWHHGVEGGAVAVNQAIVDLIGPIAPVCAHSVRGGEGGRSWRRRAKGCRTGLLRVYATFLGKPIAHLLRKCK